MDLPLHLRLPDAPLVDPMTFTMSHFDSVQYGWNQVGAKVQLMLMGNHDVRFFKYLYRHADALMEYDAIRLAKDLQKAGVLWLGVDEDRILLRRDVELGLYDFKVLHGTYARKWATVAVRAEAEADMYIWDTVQFHVHRVNEHVHTMGDGRMIRLFEGGCLCHLQPHWSKTTKNWQQGIHLAAYHPTDLSQPAEYHNLLFRRDGQHLTAVLDGMEYRVKIPVGGT